MKMTARGPGGRAVCRVRWVARVCLGLLAAAACLPLRGAEPPPPTVQTIDYAIVVTGTELLAGGYVDAHTAFLTKTLHPRGLRCVLAMIVGDRLEEIQKALQVGLEHAPLVIVTGGLGPTEDDVTRQALAGLTGIGLREHPELLAAASLRFKTPVDQLRANIRRQTQVPVRGGYLANSHGTAAGLIFDTDKGTIVALPGPPRELQPMVRETLLPYLTERYGIRAAGGLLRVRFVGIGESAISHTLEQRVSMPKDVIIGSLFDGMRVDYYFSLPGAAPEDLARLHALEKQIRGHLGDFIYGTGSTTLEAHVVEALAARKETIALAETGSGGSLAAALNESEAAAEVLVGAYVAPTDAQLRQMLGVPVNQGILDATTAKRRFADRLAELTQADWTMYVGLVSEVGAGQPRCCEAVIRHPDGRIENAQLAIRGTADLARTNLTTQLLDLLRRELRDGT